jgi:hypothetical protein
MKNQKIRRARRHQKRHRHGPKFIQLFRYMLDSSAYVSLSVWARAALVEVTRGYDGANNGNIRLSERELAKRMSCHRVTARRALQELVDKGFIEARIKGAFHIKYSRATVWRLNDRRCDATGQEQSQAFMRWTADPKPPRRKQAKLRTAEAARKTAEITARKAAQI